MKEPEKFKRLDGEIGGVKSIKGKNVPHYYWKKLTKYIDNFYDAQKPSEEELFSRLMELEIRVRMYKEYLLPALMSLMIGVVSGVIVSLALSIRQDRLEIIILTVGIALVIFVALIVFATFGMSSFLFSRFMSRKYQFIMNLHEYEIEKIKKLLDYEGDG